jgi:thiosulfate dehydrogenase (quinone) large subunit
VLVPLRAFLGVTFCFAGLQKLANPNFFRAASPISIQAQLVAAQRSSPLGHLLHPLMPVSILLGVVIALGELAVGLGVLTGVLMRVAAVGGMVISFILFITVSFHSRPFYTGADIVYFFALTPFVLAGAGTLSLPALMDRLVPTPARSRRPRPGMVGLSDRVPVDRGRRDALVAGVLAGAGLVLAALDVGLGRLARGTRPPAAPVQLGSGPAPTTTTQPAEGPATTTQPAEGPATTTQPAEGSAGTTQPPGGGVPGGTKVGPAADVPVGGSASFQDPSSGDPAIVIQAKAGDFVAFDAVCPHAGCTVGYSSARKVIVCPCHGSQFNAETGAVEQGPAASNLRRIKISEGRDGNLYVN